MSVLEQDMLLDAVDKNDEQIGVVRRGEVFAVKANFRVAHIFLFNRLNELLLQQLAPARSRHPGYWGSSVAAYVGAGETYAQAAQRRLYEELGTHSELRFHSKTSMQDEGCDKFIGFFVGTSEGPFTIDHTHIAAIEFLSLRVVTDLARTGRRQFTPTFLHLLKYYEMK